MGKFEEFIKANVYGIKGTPKGVSPKSIGINRKALEMVVYQYLMAVWLGDSGLAMFSSVDDWEEALSYCGAMGVIGSGTEEAALWLANISGISFDFEAGVISLEGREYEVPRQFTLSIPFPDERLAQNVSESVIQAYANDPYYILTVYEGNGQVRQYGTTEVEAKAVASIVRPPQPKPQVGEVNC